MPRHGGHATPSPVIMPATPEPAHSRPPSLLTTWWKQLTAVVVGLSACGALTFAIARAFFPTREEHTILRLQVDRANDQLAHLHASIEEQQHALKEIAQSLSSLRLEVVQHQAQSLHPRP